MKIINLHAENYKRLKAVEIAPSDGVVTITGRNAQGKTSVLDAIWAALAGREASRVTSQPIRDGEKQAVVRLDLGDYIVTRKWTRNDSGTLTIEAPDGARYSSPQKLLDEVIGAHAFDPLAFTRMTAREQREALLSLVDLDVDLDALAADRQRLYDERTDVGRQGGAIGDVAVDESLPADETSASTILAAISAAQEVERHNAEVARRRQASADEIADIETRIAEWQRKLADAKDGYARVDAEWQSLVAPADTARLAAQLTAVEDTNARIRANNEARSQASRKAELAGRYNDLSAAISAIDGTKAAALARVKFPIDGLGFDDGGVTFHGVPFSQASGAEQLRVSVALAMAANPTLRVLRVTDGSLLDADSMQIIRDLAADADYQVWVEVVGDGGTGIVIEDGQVAA